VGQTAEDLRLQAERQRAELSRDLEAIGDRVSPSRMVERRQAAVRQRLTRAKEAVMGTADTARDRVGSAADHVGGTASDIGSRIGDAPDAIRRQTEGNPLAAGLIAFGAGLLAATLIPTTRREEQAGRRIQPQLAQVAEEVKSEVRQAAEDLRPAAEQAVQEVKGSAQDAAQAVKDEASTAAQNVRDETRSG
jgi:gas vesicle protein